MPDRSYGSVTIYAGIADLGTPPAGTITVTSAKGTSYSASTGSISSQHYSATFTVSDSTRDDGVWSANWGSFTQRFTLAPDPGNSPTFQQLLLQTAELYKPVWYGTLTAGTGTTGTDPALIGQNEDLAGLFFLRRADSAQGDWQRVSSYAAHVLTFATAFDPVLAANEDYALLHLSPSHVEQSVRRAIRTLGTLARIPAQSEGLALSDRNDQSVLVQVPTGWATVHQVWLVDTSADTVTLLRPSQWQMQPQGMIQLSEEPSNPSDTTVTLVGWLDPLDPLWSDSLVDLDPILVSAQAASELLMGASAGQGKDSDDRIRRAAIASSQAQDLRRVRRRRVPTNSRKVWW